jgi:hypothetical protein
LTIQILKYSPPQPQTTANLVDLEVRVSSIGRPSEVVDGLLVLHFQMPDVLAEGSGLARHLAVRPFNFRVPGPGNAK